MDASMQFTVVPWCAAEKFARRCWPWESSLPATMPPFSSTLSLVVVACSYLRQTWNRVRWAPSHTGRGSLLW